MRVSLKTHVGKMGGLRAVVRDRRVSDALGDDAVPLARSSCEEEWNGELLQRSEMKGGETSGQR